MISINETGKQAINQGYEKAIDIEEKIGYIATPAVAPGAAPAVVNTPKKSQEELKEDARLKAEADAAAARGAGSAG